MGGEGDDDIGEVGEARLGMLCLSLHLTGMSLEKTKSTEHSTCSQEIFSIAALHVVVINETQKTKNLYLLNSSYMGPAHIYIVQKFGGAVWVNREDIYIDMHKT